MTAHLPAPETKSAPYDVALAYDDLARTFQDFRATSDDRLAEMRRASRPT